MAKDTVRKVTGLLNKFTTENPLRDDTAVKTKSVYQSPYGGGSLSIRLANDKLILLDRNGLVAPIDGVGFGGRYTVNVWEAVSALRAHGLISTEEETLFRNWLHHQAEKARVEERLPQLQRWAEELGFDLVKKKRGAA